MMAGSSPNRPPARASMSASFQNERLSCTVMYFNGMGCVPTTLVKIVSGLSTLFYPLEFRLTLATLPPWKNQISYP